MLDLKSDVETKAIARVDCLLVLSSAGGQTLPTFLRVYPSYRVDELEYTFIRNAYFRTLEEQANLLLFKIPTLFYYCYQEWITAQATIMWKVYHIMATVKLRICNFY